MKRVRVLVKVWKQLDYDFNELYMTDDSALEKAIEMAETDGEIKTTSLEDYDFELLEQDEMHEGHAEMEG